MTLDIQRGAEVLSLSLIPENGKIGAYIAPNITLKKFKYPLFASL